MAILVIQIIIKQWDKSQRAPEYAEERAKLPDRYLITFPTASYVFNEQCVIDLHGDDRQGNRISLSQPDDDIIQFDRFQVSISNKTLRYIAPTPSITDTTSRELGSLDNRWLQSKYEWRYGVDEGGFYYWLYEEVTLNAMYIDRIDERLFMDSQSEIVVDLA